MTTEPLSPAPSDPAPPQDPSARGKKKKNKVRGAWISFVGRILAQIIGAAASVVLGVLILQRVNNPATLPAPAAAPEPPRPAVARTPGEVMLAVLPLDNFSGDPAQEYFADGMTEALIADLAQIEGLHVISRTSTMRYKGQQKSLPEIARELGVDLIVEGSVMRADNRVRITAQLIDAKTDRHLWARSYDRTLKDVLALQADIATSIAREVKGALSPARSAALAERRAIDPAVYDLYLRGRHAWNLRSQEGFQNAARYFTEATQKDPSFALAHAGLADVYTLQNAPGITGTPGETIRNARAAAERALQLDPRLAEAHTSLAAVYFFGDRNFAAAEREFRAALALNQHYPTARQWLALCLSEQGRDAEALEHAKEAVSLDPLSGAMRQTLGLVHYYGRRYDQAIAEQRRALELNPRLPLAPTVVAKAHLMKGDPRAAIAFLGEGAQGGNAEMLMLLGVTPARAGNRPAAEAILQQLSAPPVRPGVFVQWHAATGNLDAAFDLMRTMHGPPAAVLRVDPLFEPLRADARFANLPQRPAGASN